MRGRLAFRQRRSLPAARSTAAPVPGDDATLRADFSQIVVAKNGRKPRKSVGVMMISRPGKFRWQIEKPYSQLLVGDGEKVWMYDPTCAR